MVAACYLFDEIVSTVNEFAGVGGKDDDTTLLEVCMVDESTVGEADIDLSSGIVSGPLDWNMRYTLRGHTLKTFNPMTNMFANNKVVWAIHNGWGNIIYDTDITFSINRYSQMISAC